MCSLLFSQSHTRCDSFRTFRPDYGISLPTANGLTKHTRNSYVSISCIQRDISVINAHKVNGKHRSRRTGQPRRRRPRAQNVIRFSTSRDHDAGANASGPTRPLRARVYEREHSTVGSSPRYATTVVETTRPVSKIRDERAR